MSSAIERQASEIAVRRLRQFIRAMIPIAIAYEALFLVIGWATSSVALLGGAGAVTIYLGALVVAYRALRAGRIARAALVTGGGLLAMVAIGAWFVPFQLASLVLICVAAVIVVLPHVERPALFKFAAVALVVIATVIVLDGCLPPRMAEPPAWFRDTVLLSSAIAAAILIVIMLSADHERTRTLLVAAERNAEAAHRARAATDSFLTGAAHQLRTPVSTVLLQAESLLQRTTLSKELGAPPLERIRRQAYRLQFLVDGMLDVTRANAGTLHLEVRTLDLANLVRETADRHVAMVADAPEVQLDVPAQRSFDGDTQRLALMIAQLIDNAVKRGGGKPVRIALVDVDRDIELRVSDRGPALRSDDRDHVFDLADGSEAPTTTPDGNLAIGLWLVRHLARAMRGDADVRVETDGATTFVVRLPGQAP